MLQKFFKLESATTIFLCLATSLALLLANSSFSQFYFEILKISLPLEINFLHFQKEMLLKDWVNEGLMALFFFLIGLELKKEILVGELSSKQKIILPAFAACGGVIVPAIIFFFCNFNQPQNFVGIFIPTATDIAFAYGVICFFGKKISYSLRVFVMALAVLDDLFAIFIIAIFYTKNLEIFYLILSVLPLVGLFFLNRYRSKQIIFYIIFAVILWLLILQSGIHATLSGVLVALFIPFRISKENFLEETMEKLSPFVNFVVLPIFAFANSGVKISEFSFKSFSQPLVFGIIFALFLGKQIGVTLFSFLAVKLKFATLPKSAKGTVSWLQFYAVAIFTGIGFTMSLLIGELSFVQNNTLSMSVEIILDHVKIGILIGSILSIAYGSLITCISIKTANKQYEK